MTTSENNTIEEAQFIISGFLNRFEQPSCKEQAAVVIAAKDWLSRVKSGTEEDVSVCTIRIMDNKDGVATTFKFHSGKTNKTKEAPDSHKLGAVIASFIEHVIENETMDGFINDDSAPVAKASVNQPSNKIFIDPSMN